MEITLEFAQKRIKEQKEYIEKVIQEQIDGKITMSRSLEILPSALGQLNYFEKKQELIYQLEAQNNAFKKAAEL